MASRSTVPTQEVLSSNKRQDCYRRADSNITKNKLLTEFQALIAFACYDSPSISQSGISEMPPLMAKLCFGDKDSNPDVICYKDQFLAGLNKFQGLFSNDVDSNASNGETVLTMLPCLHRQSSLNIYVGEGSIEKGILSRKSLFNATATISGRTLLRLAKEVLSNCKKMMALVMACDSPYKDGHFPSDCTWDDYAKWCLVVFQRSDTDGAHGADYSQIITCPTTNQEKKDLPRDAGHVTPSMTLERAHNPSTLLKEDGGTYERLSQALLDQEDRGVTTSEVLEHNEEQTVRDTIPPGYFFKGFLAWSLWGLIPVVESSTTTMKSLLFGNAKVDTSFGGRSASL
jgi:hypothetical protein